MQNLLSKFSIYLFLTFCIYSCQEVENFKSPDIEIISENGFCSNDTTLKMGSKVKLKLNIIANQENITNLVIKLNNGKIFTVIDTGMNTSHLEYVYEITKGNGKSENWKFIIMDKNRMKDSVEINFKLDTLSDFGEIITLQNIKLGAQNNPVYGSFYSFSQNQVFNLQNAYNNQSAIDLIYYYDIYNSTLSSPNESDAPAVFTGEFGLSNWTVKNETRYDTTMVSVSDFNNVKNDSLLIAEYDFINGKRKAKYLTNNQIISFRTSTGKLGLIYVKNVTQNDTGSILMNIKIQK